jgi:hypothetical protein
MTVTLIPQQPAEETDVANPGPVATEHKPDVRRLAVLLAQAYVFMPLFP